MMNVRSKMRKNTQYDFFKARFKIGKLFRDAYIHSKPLKKKPRNMSIKKSSSHYLWKDWSWSKRETQELGASGELSVLFLDEVNCYTWERNEPKSCS